MDKEIKRPRALTAADVECRVATCKASGVSLLLYKTARCDMQILDETYGPMNWQRRHSRDNANCTIAVWDDDKKQWVEKEDTGTESNTEAEKGLASDSFKRAGVNWGIGRELYTAPFIWISAANADVVDSGRKDKWGKPIYQCNTLFSVTAMDVKGGRITALTIAANGKTVYKMGNVEPQRDTNAAAARLASRAECQRAVKAYCQKNNADEADAWKLIAETIGKPSKDFTAEDWKQGQQIAEAWK